MKKVDEISMVRSWLSGLKKGREHTSRSVRNRMYRASSPLDSIQSLNQFSSVIPSTLTVLCSLESKTGSKNHRERGWSLLPSKNVVVAIPTMIFDLSTCWCPLIAASFPSSRARSVVFVPMLWKRSIGPFLRLREPIWWPRTPKFILSSALVLFKELISISSQGQV